MPVVLQLTVDVGPPFGGPTGLFCLAISRPCNPRCIVTGRVMSPVLITGDLA